MVFLGAMALSMVRQEIQPVLWLDLRGNVTVDGRAVTPRFTPGANRVKTQDGVAYNFNGQHGGILFGDLAPLRLTGSITVSTWINARSYVNDGPGAEILFRGDDRSGYDPYWFVIQDDGTINFCVADGENHGMGVKAELPLNRWVQVTASFNDRTGELNMWLNGERVAYARTSHRPARDLISQYTPGVAIGNVQNDHGPHNQPFNGMIADLRVYPAALTPDDLGPIIERNNIVPPLLARR